VLIGFSLFFMVFSVLFYSQRINFSLSPTSVQTVFNFMCVCACVCLCVCVFVCVCVCVCFGKESAYVVSAHKCGEFLD